MAGALQPATGFATVQGGELYYEVSDLPADAGGIGSQREGLPPERFNRVVLDFLSGVL
jgi:hypothetical protein